MLTENLIYSIKFLKSFKYFENLIPKLQKRIQIFKISD